MNLPDISQNTASISKAKLATKFTSQPKTKKFSAAGQPAGITSKKTKMLGDNRYSPNPAPNTTATDPFASLPHFSPDKMHKLDHDDRSSSISDTDDSCSVQLDRESRLGPKPAPGKKTRGRVKIQMEYIHNKLRRYTTFSKRKSGIMKKAYELSTLTGTQVMLLVASETGHVYTFATPKLQPMITSEAGKALIQTCLHQPDPPNAVAPPPPAEYDMRMSASGFEETDLGYQLPEEDFKSNMEHGYHVASTATPMPTILNAGPIVTIPHGVMPMPGFHGTIQDGQTMTAQPMNPVMTHAQMPHIQPSPVAVSPHHSSPPPSYSPPQPPSPPRAAPYTPPSAHMSHTGVMMEELHSPSLTHHHGGVEVYDRSPSRSPIQQHRYSHSPPTQGLYAAPGGSPPGIRI